MYEVVTDRTEQPVITILEAELEAIYCSAQRLEKMPYFVQSSETTALSSEAGMRQQGDLLRQFLTFNEKGFFLEIRFSHDEFAFLSSMTRWLARLSMVDLTSFPDLTELVVREFRKGEPIETLPMSDLKAYSERWSKSLWQTILTYKAMTRDLHENYQTALKEWSVKGMSLT